jgi:HAD superfamily hydrolase (TIGR01509 family)
MAEYGHQWTTEDQRYCLGGPLPKVGAYMWKLSGERESPEFFHQELVKRVISQFENGIEFMPGAHELLAAAKDEGIPIGLVTASPIAMMEATLSRFPKDFFDVAVSGDDVQFTKPDPACYFLAAQKLGLDITQCLVLEDSLTGIKAGSDSGAFVVAIPHLVTVAETARIRVLSSLENVSLSQLEELYTSEYVARSSS